MMNISSTNNQTKLAFGRAFTTKEMDIYTKKLAEARELYEIKDPLDFNKPQKLNNTALILPDFYAPKGTISSSESLKFVKLMQQMNGINVVQALPRTFVTKDNRSPFSGSPFEIGEQLIDLEKLGAPDLETAYKNFKKLPEDNSLKKDFKTFNEENPHLEKYGMLEVLKKQYGTDYWPNWQGEKAELDQNLFNYDKNRETKIKEELKSLTELSKKDVNLKKENREKSLILGKELKEILKKKVRQEELKKDDAVDFYKFKQFIATKQHLETKENLNNEGIKLFGDCLIGFSYRDQWAFKPAFEEGKTLGAMANENGKDVFRDWGTPCLNSAKLYNQNGSLGAAGELLKKKFDVFLTNYDGARIDAGWQLSNPISSKNNPLNSSSPEILGTKMLNIMQMAINDQIKNGHAIQKEDINIEALGGPRESVLLTKNKFPHIHITRYAKDEWGRFAFYNSIRNSNDHEKTNTGYKLTGITIGPGCHDDRSLIDLSNTERENQSDLLAGDLTFKNDSEEAQKVKFAKELKTNPETFRNAKFAEIFTARNQFFTAPDALGDKRRLNNPDANTQEEKSKNWTAQTPSDFEKAYFQNLSKGKGLNTPKALALAIRAKMGENDKTKEILSFLDKAGRILRKENGPNTIETATKIAESNPKALGERLDA